MNQIPVEAKITEYLHRKAALSRTPLSGTFELTPLCNMNCRMCYVRLTKQQQESIGPLHTADEWIRMAEKAKEEGLLYLLLTGGEPFTHPEFRTILEAFHRMGFLLTVNTNATMIDESVVVWLKESPPVRMNITLYGASDETYGRLCGNPKGFTQAVHAIDLLQEAGISLRINCSITPYNRHDVSAIVNFCIERGLILAPTAYMFPPLRRNIDMVGQNDRFTPEEAAEAQAEVEYLMAGPQRFLERVKTRNLEGLVTDREEDCFDTEGKGLKCRAGKCAFWITWYGRMIPCGMMSLTDPFMNVFEDDFKDCWERVAEETEKIRLPGKCENCSLNEICRPCGAMTYTETGYFDQIPEYRCRMAHAYPEACLKIVSESKDLGGWNETEEKR